MTPTVLQTTGLTKVFKLGLKRRVVEAVSWAVCVALAVPFLHILYTFWLAAHPVG